MITTSDTTSEATDTHACERLGELLRDLLAEWASVQPENCQKITYLNLSGMRSYQVVTGETRFDIALSEPWSPSEAELAILDRAVFRAATARGWKSSVVPEFFESQQVFRGKTILGNYVAESECCEGAIARLQSYLAANRGEY